MFLLRLQKQAIDFFLTFPFFFSVNVISLGVFLTIFLKYVVFHNVLFQNNLPFLTLSYVMTVC